MKTKYLVITFIVFLLSSCSRREQTSSVSPFKPSLDLILRELIDSLKNKVGEKDLLSLVFKHSSECTDYCNIYNDEIEIYLLDYYASSCLDGYVRYDDMTIALYNLKKDIFELVNKNEITFFIDTITGYKDLCGLDLTAKKSFVYEIILEDSIKRVCNSRNPSRVVTLRRSRCKSDLSIIIPEKLWFYEDSLRAEENFQFYKNEVEYFRKKSSEKNYLEHPRSARFSDLVGKGSSL